METDTHPLNDDVRKLDDMDLLRLIRSDAIEELRERFMAISEDKIYYKSKFLATWPQMHCQYSTWYNLAISQKEEAKKLFPEIDHSNCTYRIGKDGIINTFFKMII